MTMITYAELQASHAGEALTLPVFVQELPAQITLYLPDWTPATRVQECQARGRATWEPQVRFGIVLVTEVPEMALMDEWREAAARLSIVRTVNEDETCRS